MIEVCGVKKSFRSGMTKRYGSGGVVEALRGVDMRIEDSGFYAIMGPSGSGKSTLLHLIAGLDRPDGGEIIVNGDAVHSMNEKGLTAYRRLKIGIVFQKFNLIPTMDARTNILLPGLLDGRNGRELKARVDELIEQFELGDRALHRPDALSGGEQQRVALARALLFEPSVLLADEPTGNLDSTASENIWQMLAELSLSHCLTVVMVTHEPAAAAHCKHVFLLQDGRITTDFGVETHDSRWVADRYQQSQDAAR